MKFPYKIEGGLTINAAHSPRWADRENISMTCVLETEEHGQIPFLSCPFDDWMDHPALIFRHLAEGNAGPVDEWQRPDPSAFDLQQDLDKLMPDITLGLATPEEIEVARLLRIQIKAMTS